MSKANWSELLPKPIDVLADEDMLMCAIPLCQVAGKSSKTASGLVGYEELPPLLGTSVASVLRWELTLLTMIDYLVIKEYLRLGYECDYVGVVPVPKWVSNRKGGLSPKRRILPSLTVVSSNPIPIPVLVVCVGLYLRLCLARGAYASAIQADPVAFNGIYPDLTSGLTPLTVAELREGVQAREARPEELALTWLRAYPPTLPRIAAEYASLYPLLIRRHNPE
jgi:hypothetical protein